MVFLYVPGKCRATGGSGGCEDRGQEREGGKPDSRGGGNLEKLRNVFQHFVIACN